MGILNKAKYPKSFGVFFVALLLLSSCKKDKAIGPQCVDCAKDSVSIDTSVAQVYIMNEGNYGWNNGSISLYTPNDRKVQNNIFQSVNGLVLGDVVQSMQVIDDKAYIVVNNSNKIEVVDKSNFVSTTTISGMNTPRYICPVSKNKAYVSSLFGNAIYVLDLQNNIITDTVVVRGWTEKMVAVKEKLYIVSPDSNKVVIIDTQNNVIIEEKPVTKFPNSIVRDINDNVWVLSSGGYNEELPELIRLNTNNDSIEVRFTFSDISQSPENLCIDITNEHLYYTNIDVYRMNITDKVLPTGSYISSPATTTYKLGVAPNNDVYISDAVNYTQQGYVYRYSSLPALIDSFKVGIIPGEFWFE